MKNKDGGEGEVRLNRGGGGGLVDFPPLKRGGGVLERGGFLEYSRYVTFLSQHIITISSLRTRLKQKEEGTLETRF